MAKPELGLKRQCLHCGAKFYDLNRDPIVCPKCGEIFEIIDPHASSAASDDGELDVMVGSPEIVSLDDVAAAESLNDPLKDDIDLDVDDAVGDDDTFLEDEEEGDEDVTDFIDSDLNDDDDS